MFDLEKEEKYRSLLYDNLNLKQSQSDHCCFTVLMLTSQYH